VLSIDKNCNNDKNKADGIEQGERYDNLLEFLYVRNAVILEFI